MTKKRMSFNQAIIELVKRWGLLPAEFKRKFASSKSKFISHIGIGDKKKRQMLEDAGFKNYWEFPEEWGI